MTARIACVAGFALFAGACAAGADAAYYARYCTERGYSEGSQAFDDCVAAKRHEIETERKRRVRPPDPAELG